jgi:hypothetical protein
LALIRSLRFEPDLPNAAFQGLARTLNSFDQAAAKQAAAAKREKANVRSIVQA